MVGPDGHLNPRYQNGRFSMSCLLSHLCDQWLRMSNFLIYLVGKSFVMLIIIELKLKLPFRSLLKGNNLKEWINESMNHSIDFQKKFWIKAFNWFSKKILNKSIL